VAAFQKALVSSFPVSIVGASTPCAAPRFDVFSERLICSWTDETNEKSSVEEVMRSCGGAVQGVREMTIVSPAGASGEDDGLYLNRANDGFVFMDSGFYTFGPTSISEDTMKDLNVVNFMFGKTSRLLLTGTTSGQDASFLRKTFGGSDLLSPEIEWADDYDKFPVMFESVIQCSTPGPGQPWNLQRAKWCKNSSSGDCDDEAVSPEKLSCWMTSNQPASQFAEWSGLSTTFLGAGWDAAGSVFSAGVVCPAAGTIQAMARFYSDSGSLTNTLYLRGSLSE